MRPTQGTLASTVRSDSAQGATVCPQDEISREYLSFLEHFDFIDFPSLPTSVNMHVNMHVNMQNKRRYTISKI